MRWVLAARDDSGRPNCVSPKGQLCCAYPVCADLVRGYGGRARRRQRRHDIDGIGDNLVTDHRYCRKWMEKAKRVPRFLIALGQGFVQRMCRLALALFGRRQLRLFLLISCFAKTVIYNVLYCLLYVTLSRVGAFVGSSWLGIICSLFVAFQQALLAGRWPAHPLVFSARSKREAEVAIDCRLYPAF